jgi:YVTN family beta-propeller protein
MSPESNVNGRDVQVITYNEFDETSAVPVTVRIPVNEGPISGIVASPDGSRLMVTNYGADSVSVIDTDTCRVVGTVDGVSEPFAIASASADRVYVSTVSPAYDSIEVIDTSTNTVIGTHPLALSVSDLTASHDGKYVYATRNGARGADVAILDTTTGNVKVIDVADASKTPGISTQCVRISPDGGHLYVGINGPAGGQLVVIQTGAASEVQAGNTEGRSRWRSKKTSTATKAKRRPKGANTELSVVGTIEIGLTIRDIAISPNGAIAYVASTGPDFGAVVDVIDTRTNKITSTRKIAEVAGLLTRLTLSRDGDRAYLVSDESVTMLCTLTQDVIGTVDVATQPSCVIESPDGNYLYVADYSGVVTVAPVGSTGMSVLTTGKEQAALESKRSVDLFVPDMLQYEPALA